MEHYILALDQGTTSSRAIVFDPCGRAVASAQEEFEQVFPRPGWVEHDAEEIWRTQRETARQAMRKAGIDGGRISGIGITNQRETVVVWDRATGKPVYNAIVWQDRRTADQTDALKSRTASRLIKERTGLLPDPYFSASKLAWIIERVSGVREAAEAGRLACGTIDSWLIYRLTEGARHCTDVTNASRTMLFDIHRLEWDDDLLDLFGIPRAMLPEVVPSSGVLGHTAPAVLGQRIPIGGVAGDQQAALFGQGCVSPGMLKCTYGTGCFVLVNTGDRPHASHSDLLTTVAWQLDGQPAQYALEGSVFIGGAAIQWLRDGLGLIKTAPEVNTLAATVESSDGVWFVPAFVGLGAPHWDPSARGTILGVTRGTTGAHIAHATLEAIAYQVADVVGAMAEDLGAPLTAFRVDGGAAASDLLMQLQADIVGLECHRPQLTETTALGAARLAGLGVGLWPDLESLPKTDEGERVFKPATERHVREERLAQWHRAVERSKGWAV